MSATTPCSPDNYPKTCFEDFQFNEIGQQPQLLKRMSATTTAFDYNEDYPPPSESFPSVDQNMISVDVSENSRSRPTLFEALGGHDVVMSVNGEPDSTEAGKSITIVHRQLNGGSIASVSLPLTSRYSVGKGSSSQDLSVPVDHTQMNRHSSRSLSRSVSRPRSTMNDSNEISPSVSSGMEQPTLATLRVLHARAKAMVANLRPVSNSEVLTLVQSLQGQYATLLTTIRCGHNFAKQVLVAARESMDMSQNCLADAELMQLCINEVSAAVHKLGSGEEDHGPAEDWNESLKSLNDEFEHFDQWTNARENYDAKLAREAEEKEHEQAQAHSRSRSPSRHTPVRSSLPNDDNTTLNIEEVAIEEGAIDAQREWNLRLERAAERKRLAEEELQQRREAEEALEREHQRAQEEAAARAAELARLKAERQKAEEEEKARQEEEKREAEERKVELQKMKQAAQARLEQQKKLEHERKLAEEERQLNAERQRREREALEEAKRLQAEASKLHAEKVVPSTPHSEAGAARQPQNESDEIGNWQKPKDQGQQPSRASFENGVDTPQPTTSLSLATSRSGKLPPKPNSVGQAISGSPTRTSLRVASPSKNVGNITSHRTLVYSARGSTVPSASLANESPVFAHSHIAQRVVSAPSASQDMQVSNVGLPTRVHDSNVSRLQGLRSSVLPSRDSLQVNVPQRTSIAPVDNNPPSSTPPPTEVSLQSKGVDMGNVVIIPRPPISPEAQKSNLRRLMIENKIPFTKSGEQETKIKEEDNDGIMRIASLQERTVVSALRTTSKVEQESPVFARPLVRPSVAEPPTPTTAILSSARQSQKARDPRLAATSTSAPLDSVIPNASNASAVVTIATAPSAAIGTAPPHVLTSTLTPALPSPSVLLNTSTLANAQPGKQPTTQNKNSTQEFDASAQMGPDVMTTGGWTHNNSVREAVDAHSHGHYSGARRYDHYSPSPQPIPLRLTRRVDHYSPPRRFEPEQPLYRGRRRSSRSGYGNSASRSPNSGGRSSRSPNNLRRSTSLDKHPPPIAGTKRSRDEEKVGGPPQRRSRNEDDPIQNGSISQSTSSSSLPASNTANFLNSEAQVAPLAMRVEPIAALEEQPDILRNPIRTTPLMDRMDPMPHATEQIGNTQDHQTSSQYKAPQAHYNSYRPNYNHNYNHNGQPPHSYQARDDQPPNLLGRLTDSTDPRNYTSHSYSHHNRMPPNRPRPFKPNGRGGGNGAALEQRLSKNDPPSLWNRLQGE